MGKEEDDDKAVSKIYRNNGYPAAGLRVPQAKQFLGGLLIMVPCLDPSGQGFPFGFHAWLKMPGEAYNDLRCQCLDEEEPSGGKAKSLSRQW